MLYGPHHHMVRSNRPKRSVGWLTVTSRRNLWITFDAAKRKSLPFPGMTRSIHVDRDALRRLARDLAGLADRLEHDNDGIGDSVGDPNVAMALKDVQHDWSRKRTIITGYLRGAGEAASAAADAYEHTETTIARAASAGGPAR